MHVEDLDQSNIEVVKKNLENLERGIFALEMDVMNLEKHQDHLKEMYVLRDAYDRDIRALRMHS
jgi:hypothetical protein